MPLDPLSLPIARGLESQQKASMAPCFELDGLFTAKECDRIIALREELGFDHAPVVVPGSVQQDRVYTVDNERRKTERTHIMHTPDTHWIFNRLGQAVEQANSRWRFRVNYMEPIQLLAYGPGGHFQWHTDLGDRGLTSLRKISATILLSSPGDYEGGRLEYMTGGKAVQPTQRRGSGVFFPSFINHRVTPVDSGMRYVLALWTVGKRSYQ